MMAWLMALLMTTMSIYSEASTAAGTVRIRRNARAQFGVRPIFASASASASSFGSGSAFASASSSASASASASPSAFASGQGAANPILSSNPFFNGAFNSGLGNTRFNGQGNRNEQFTNEVSGNQPPTNNNNRFGNQEPINQNVNNIGNPNAFNSNLDPTSGSLGSGPVGNSPTLNAPSGPHPQFGGGAQGGHPFGSNSRAPPGFGFQGGYAAQNPNK